MTSTASRRPSITVEALYRLCATIAVLVVASSRIYLGAHYPTDVLASAVYGIGLVIVILLIDAWLQRGGWTELHTTAVHVDRPARLVDRAFAVVVDASLYVLALLPALFVLVAEDPPGPGRIIVAGVLLLGALVAFGAHDIWFVSRYGGTIGHRTRRLQIVEAATGHPVGPPRAVNRWALQVGAVLLLLMPLLTLLNAVMIGIRRDGRALHDVLTGTAVVRTDRQA